MNWSMYEKRLNINGISKKEREINSFKLSILNNSDDLIACKQVLINNENQKIIINNPKNNEYEILSLPDETFEIGSIVNWNNVNLLISEADENDICTKGKMKKCNYNLTYQDKNNNIKHTPVIIKTNNRLGEDESKYITIGDDQLLMYIPFNQDSCNFSVNQRFFIDNNINKPTSYKITKINNIENIVTKDNNRIGYLVIILTETQLSDKDRVDLFICDYKENVINVDDYHITIDYYGKPIIKVGRDFKMFTATLYNKSGDKVTSNIQWNIDKFSDKFEIENDNNIFKIKTNDENLYGEIITIIATDINSNCTTSLELSIVDM